MRKSFSTLIGNSLTCINLHQFINTLIYSYLNEALEKNTIVVNKVSKEIFIDSSNLEIQIIIKQLLVVVIDNSLNGDILITAERSRDMIFLNIEERNNYNGYALAFSIAAIEPDAMTTGGFIFMKEPKKKNVTISFGFPTEGKISSVFIKKPGQNGRAIYFIDK